MKINTMTTLLLINPYLVKVTLYVLSISQLDDDYMFCKILAICIFCLIK